MFDHPVTLFLYVFSNLTIALACFCVAFVMSARSSVTGKVARIGGRIFFTALGLLLVDVTMMALFSSLDPKSIEWAWHALTLRVIAAVGMSMLAGGLYLDADTGAMPWRRWLHRPEDQQNVDRSERID